MVLSKNRLKKKNRAPEKKQYHYAKTRQHPKVIKSLINRIKIYLKRIAIAAGKSAVKRRSKIKNLESLGTLQ